MMNTIDEDMVHFGHCRGIFGGNYAESFNALKFYINLLLVPIEHFCMLYLHVPVEVSTV